MLAFIIIYSLTVSTINPKNVSDKMWSKKEIREFIANSKRVLVVAKKPDMDEFLKALKITTSAVLFIGAIGFIIFTLFQFLL